MLSKKKKNLSPIAIDGGPSVKTMIGGNISGLELNKDLMNTSVDVPLTILQSFDSRKLRLTVPIQKMKKPGITF
jgi:hypothetical protein